MLICGVKTSHDGGIAVIEDGRLAFSVEIEKLANGHRYSPLGDLRRIPEILASEGLALSDVDRFVVDGWWTPGANDGTVVHTALDGAPLDLAVAPYLEGTNGPLTRHTFHALPLSGAGDGYSSYHHSANHLMGAYCSSPFATRGEDAFVLVWDGGMVPRLYEVRAAERSVTLVSALFPITGNAFADFSGRFDPFYRPDADHLSADEGVLHHLSIAGKAMAYAALGRVERDVFSVFDELFAGFTSIGPDSVKILASKIADSREQLVPGLTDVDLIATFQDYLGSLLVRRLTSVIARLAPGRTPHLALSGGCALNIKWNSALRATGAFDEIWVPPFPNDAGAAIGTAVCELFYTGGLALDWNVYSGPLPVTGPVPAGWRPQPCTAEQLGELLHTEGAPVVVIDGRAEIGPRALGNRSILAPATSPAMKDRLNEIKDRAPYRPVAPLCLTTRAAEVFTPGFDDQYMLFEHRVRPEWQDRIPAVIHLDGTARLQTIDERSGSATARILASYERASGIPVLCNTSANLNGKGFFPDVASAAEWGLTHYIWSNGVLYTNPAPVGVDR